MGPVLTFVLRYPPGTKCDTQRVPPGAEPEIRIRKFIFCVDFSIVHFTPHACKPRKRFSFWIQ